LPSEAYDGIVCSSVIEYAPDPAQFLQALRSSLRPSGTLLISFANSLSLPRVWDPLRMRDSYQAVRKHTWSWPRFLELLEANGFTAARPPRYFRTFTDRIAPLRLLAGSRFWGGLGLVIAKKK
jgi:SAM-dependent methyltransferase